MPGITVTRPGLLTTVQDMGRWGWQAQGVSVSGPMDSRAHRTANARVGNDPSAATLEITLTGPELRFEDDRLIAVCGAPFTLTIDGEPAAMGVPHAVSRGTVLRFGGRQGGARAYLAVSGGLAVPPLFGSRATHVPGRLGGFNGRPLQAGDRLPLGPATGAARAPGGGWPATPPIPIPRGHARLRVLPTVHPTRFRADALDQLQSGPYRLRSESDRMGYRLEGPPLQSTVGGAQLSEPSPIGSIQIPPDGGPILLMADCQTMGGYPVIGTVISADLGLAGQVGPGDTLAFTVCTRHDAVAALIALERTLMAAS